MNAPRLSWKQWLLTDTPASRKQAALGLAYRRWRRFAGNPLSVFGFAILMVLVIVAIIGPWIAPHDPLRQVLSDRLLPPGLGIALARHRSAWARYSLAHHLWLAPDARR